MLTLLACAFCLAIGAAAGAFSILLWAGHTIKINW